LEFHERDWAKVSILAKDLVEKMLLRDPNERPSAKKCLNHDWF
jgi:calcium-dependent protein kinase